MEDIHISKAEFKKLQDVTQPSGMIRIVYDPDDSLHANIVEQALDQGLLQEEPQMGDTIQFSADFNIFLMNLDDFENKGQIEPREQEEDPNVPGGRRRPRRKTHRKTKKNLKK